MEPSQQEDRRLVQKLIRYFIFRAIQVILQSRSSKVFRCSCKVYSPQVSLGLSLEDDPSIAVSIKSQFSSNFELRNNDSHSVEIYLCSERSPVRVFLEVWTFHFSDEETDPAIKRMKTFDRLVVALKALWSISRVLPAYRIARRQQISDRCLLCFNIRRGSSSSNGSSGGASAALGSDSGERRIASIRTAAGQLTLTCCYRSGAGLDPRQLEAALAPIGSNNTSNNGANAEDEEDEHQQSASSAPTPPPRISSRRCLSTTTEPTATEEDEDSTNSDDLEEEEEEEEEEDATNATHSSGSSAEQELAFQSGGAQCQQPQLELSMTDSQLAACFANADTDAADDVSEAEAEQRRLQLIRRLKSLNLRLSMFSGCSTLTSRIGAIPQQLDFFERDLADFDLLLNDILARDDADCNAA